MIVDCYHNNVSSVAFWSDMEKIVRASGNITPAVLMGQIQGTHSTHKKNYELRMRSLIAELARMEERFINEHR